MRVYLLIFLLMIPFSYSFSINIISPESLGEYGSGVIPIEWSVDSNFRQCSYQIDNSSSIYSISMKGYQKISDISSSDNSSWHLDTPLAVYNDNNQLYVASTDALNSFSVSDVTDIQHANQNSAEGFNYGYNPRMIKCSIADDCYVMFSDSNILQQFTRSLEWSSTGDYDLGSLGYDMRIAPYREMFVTMPLQDRIFYLGSYDPIEYYGFKSGSGSPNYLGYVRGIERDDYYGINYAASSGDSSLTVWETTFTCSPGFSGTQTLIQKFVANSSMPIYGIYDVVLAGNYLYALSSENKSVSIFNATNRTSLRYVKTYSDLSLNATQYLKLFYYDNILYVLNDGVFGRFLAYDISSRLNMSLVYSSSSSGFVQDITGYDSILYAADPIHDRIDIYSTMIPLNSTLSGLSVGSHKFNLTCKGLDGLIYSQIHFFNVFSEDYDNDGIIDSEDNCVFVSNPSQADADFLPNGSGEFVGDIEINSDGGDACDLCVNQFDLYAYAPNCVNDPWCSNDYYPDDYDVLMYFAGFIGSIQIYQKDSDGDSIGDKCDNCPDVINNNQLDSDSDGFGNACDDCPFYYDPSQDSPCTFCPIGQANISGTCYSANCSNGVKDEILGEIDIDYGGYCGTCEDGIAQCTNFTAFNFTFDGINYSVGSCQWALSMPQWAWTSLSGSEFSSFPDFGGRCGTCLDGIVNPGEIFADYGGHCGTCDDNQVSYRINESERDYGGYYCGSCDGSGVLSDASWIAIDAKNVPFDKIQCEEGEANLGGAILILMVGIFILIIMAVAFSILGTVIFSFLISGIINGFLENRNKNKNIYINHKKR